MLQDFDGGEVGQFVSRAVVASSGAPTAPTWSVVATDLFPNGVHDLENAVIQEKAWAIIASTSIILVFIFRITKFYALAQSAKMRRKC
jgi:hypothetical protein